MEIIGDACYHRLPGGTRGSGAGPHIRITVTDSGVGMSLEIAARAFEPFFTTKESTRAVGLGLAVAKGIARQHCGWIEFETVPNRGTSFHVFLPVDPCSSSRPTLRHLDLRQYRGRRHAFPV